MSGAIDPRYLDLALALIALEGAGLLVWRWRRGEGPRAPGLIANLVAGASLLLVARALLTGAGPAWTLAALTAALTAHGFDLITRWERRPGA